LPTTRSAASTMLAAALPCVTITTPVALMTHLSFSSPSQIAMSHR
jgi:hypothetical protein